MNQKNYSEVVIVTVTYGERFDLLSSGALKTASEMKFDVVIVLNGVSDSYLENINTLSSNVDFNLSIVNNNENLGSAQGFKQGLVWCRSHKSKSNVLFLDDDNYIDSKFRDNIVSLCKSAVDKGFCFIRPDRKYMKMISEGYDCSDVLPKKNSFMGFSLERVLMVFKNKIYKKKINSSHVSNGCFLPVIWAPYGGVLLKNSILDKVDLPDEEYFLYADDTDFTYKISKKFGLFMDSSVVVDDVEKSWNVKEERSLFNRILLSGDDWRVKYSVRNQAYFDFWIYSNSKTTVLLNFVSFLSVFSFLFIVLSVKNFLLKKYIPFGRFKIVLKYALKGVFNRRGKILD